MSSFAAPPDVAAVILAGGRARRMEGADKPLLLLGGRPLITYAIAALKAPDREQAISANGDVARFAALGLPVLQDRDTSFAGPLAGVLAGLEWAETRGATRLLTAPADCPFLPENLAERLIEACGSGTMTHARAGGRDHPTTALWPVSARRALAAYLACGERRVMGFLSRFGSCAVDWDEAAAFMNINTPEDLQQAEARLAQRECRGGKI